MIPAGHRLEPIRLCPTLLEHIFRLEKIFEVRAQMLLLHDAATQYQKLYVFEPPCSSVPLAPAEPKVSTQLEIAGFEHPRDTGLRPVLASLEFRCSGFA
jgi:hypothetical protein